MHVSECMSSKYVKFCSILLPHTVHKCAVRCRCGRNKLMRRGVRCGAVKIFSKKGSCFAVRCGLRKVWEMLFTTALPLCGYFYKIRPFYWLIWTFDKPPSLPLKLSTWFMNDLFDLALLIYLKMMLSKIVVSSYDRCCL